MYETIQQPIDVLVAFSKDKVQPKVFRWQNQKYHIKDIHLIHSAKRGQSHIYYFSVSYNTQYFKISFDSTMLTWMLEEVYMEG
ncbi:MAG: hypothetical protein AAB733_02590 [Patescibacteria group bacterium]